MPHDKSPARFGERIAYFRKVRGLTQEQLGEAIGRTAQSISDYENGITTAPTEVLARIAELLAVSFASLLGQTVGFAEPGPGYEAGPPASDRIGTIFAEIRRAVDLAERRMREDYAFKRV